MFLLFSKNMQINLLITGKT